MTTQALLLTLLVAWIGPTQICGTVTLSVLASPHLVDENDEVSGSWSLTLTAQKNMLTDFTWTKVSVSPNSAGDFQIEASGGGSCNGTASCVLSILTSKPLDYESGTTSYTVEIEAKDTASPSDSATATITILVNDINDETPTIAPGNLTQSVNENMNPSTLIGTIIATDADSGDTLTYSISGGNASLLHINPSDGKLYSLQKYDYEAGTTSLTTTLTVSDSKATTPNSATGTLTVNIIAVNDNTPVCSPSSLYAEIAENSNSGTSVATVACTDGDTSDTITYALLSGNDANKFTINTSSGLVTTSATLDYENTQSYMLEVTGTDGSTTATATLQIQVVDIGDTPPVLTSGSGSDQGTVTIAEDVAVGTSLHTLTANGTEPIAFSIVNVVDAGNTTQSGFFVIEERTGIIKTKCPINREMADASYYVLTMKAEVAGSFATFATLNVSVTDVNDNNPVFNPEVNVVEVAENLPSGTAVVTLTATDADVTGNSVTVEIISGDDTSPKFSLNSTSGEIVTLNALDYEATPSYMLVVRGTDDGTPNRTSTVTVNVKVVDIGDTPPVLTSGSGSDQGTVTIAEDVAVGTSLHTLTANGTEPIAFSIVNVVDAGNTTQSGFFVIEERTGIIKTKCPINREMADASYYVLTMKAEVAGSFATFATLNVSVTDVNDNNPVFNPEVNVVEVAENLPSGTAVVTLTATDADVTGNSVTVEIISGDDPSPKFSLNSTSGEIVTLNALDYEATPSYMLVVRGTDDGTPNRTSTVTVNVKVVDIGDTPPVLTSGSGSDQGTVTIAEDVAVGTSLHTLTASGTEPIAFSIVNVVDAGNTTQSGFFVIEERTGIIKTKCPINREMADASYYVLTMKAEVAGSFATFATLNVSVTDVNDNNPVFNPEVNVVEVAENLPSGTAVVTLTATDADVTGNSVTVEIISGDDPSPKFSLNSTSGEIVTLNALDYEATPSYMLVVRGTDDGTPNRTSTVTVNVKVVDIGDTPPVLTSGSGSDQGTVTIAEDVAVGTSLHTLTASGTEPIAFSIVNVVDAGNTTQSGFFVIEERTGIIKTKCPINREMADASYYVLTMKAEVAGSFATFATLNVSVTDVNDNNPVFNPEVNVVEVAENLPSGTAVVTLTATDADVTGNSVTVEIISGDDPSPKFSLNSTSGEIVTLNALDYEATPSYMLVVRGTDDGTPNRTSTVTVNVKVVDIGDTPPVLTSGSGSDQGTVTIAEDVAVGTSLHTLTASGTEPIAFSIVNVVDAGNTTQSGFFVIEERTGIIKTKCPINREMADASYYVLTMKAEVAGSFATFATLNVSVTDVNDNNPVFNPEVNVVEVAENLPSGTAVVTLTATDADVTGNSVTVEIISGDDPSPKFSLNSTSGEIVTLNALDYEATPSYMLVVRGTDDGTPNRTSTVTVNVKVVDIGDTPPVLTSGSGSDQGTVTIAEDVAVGTSLHTLTASGTEPIAFSIVNVVDAGNTTQSGFFVIEERTGIIKTKCPINREMADASYYVLTMKAEVAGSFATFATLNVSVTDVNDNNPVFNPEVNVVEVAENLPSGTAVVTLTATDADVTGNSVTVEIISGDDPSPKFSLNSTSGEIVTLNALDYEATPSYMLVVRGTDDGTPNRTSTVTVNVKVKNVADVAPSWSSNGAGADQGNYTILEDVACGTVITTVQATEAVGSVTYSVVSVTDAGGNNASGFTVGGSSGTIRTNALLDRDTSENSTSYLLTVKAENELGNSVTGSVLVFVTDVNDITPLCNPDQLFAVIDENSAQGTSIVNVSCTDGDATGSTVEYAITDGDDAANKFTIDSSSGEVKLSNTSLDFETKTSYDLTITATDNMGGTPRKTANASISVKVKNVADVAPSWSSNGAGADQGNYTILEDVAFGTAITTVQVTEAVGSVTYSMVSVTDAGGNTASGFTIGGSSGTIRTSALLDRDTSENSTSYLVIVKAENELGNSVNGSVMVFVTDVNDITPVCNPDQVFAVVDENSAEGTSIANVSCSDGDATGSTMEYAITDGDDAAHKFTIDSSTGEVKLSNNSLDFETKSSYDLTITATDNMGGTPRKTANASISVKVKNVADVAPSWSSNGAGADQGNYTILEDVACGTAITTVQATEAVGSVTYSVVSVTDAGGNTASGFTIGGSSGTIRTSALLDRDTSENSTSYLVTIKAENELGNSVNGSVMVFVTDVNDITPVCNPDQVFAVVDENSAEGTSIANVSCTDGDATGSTLEYAITDGDDAANKFTIDSSTGEVKLSNNSLDFETKSSYDLTITATDNMGGTPRKTANASISVKVKNVADVAPSWSSNGAGADQGNYTIMEDTPFGTAITTVQATEAVGSVTYSVVSIIDAGGNTASGFTIGGSSGTIRTSALLDRDTSENSTSYLVTVKAENELGNSVNGSVMVFVTDVNDITPVCNPDQLFAVIDENSAEGTSIANVSCTDGDATGSTVEYAITDGDDAANKFTIDSSTGEVKLSNSSLDFENKTSYDLTITATDNMGGTPRKTANASISVKVKNVADVAPSWSSNGAGVDQGNYTILEDVAFGTVITTVQATEAVGSVTYSVVSVTDAGGNAASGFTIGGSSGTIRTSALLDRDTSENSTSYLVTVKAENELGNSVNGSVMVFVTDVNDITPVCNPDQVFAVIDENSAEGSSIANVSCTDGDATGSTMEYAITDGDDAANKFTIDSSTGEVKLSNNSLDFETKSSYDLTITATDNMGGTPRKTANASISVKVTDVNEATVMWNDDPSSQMSLSVAETVSLGTAVYTLNATGSGDMTYAITGIVDDQMNSVTSAFVVDSATGVIRTGCTPYEADGVNNVTAYTVTCRATDSGNPQKSIEANVTIAVTDVNEHNPTFASGVHVFSVDENATVGTVVGALSSVSDGDASTPTFSYVTLSGDSQGKFLIDNSTGEVKVAQTIDLDDGVGDPAKYSLQVQVSDGGNIPLYGTASVVVAVTPINQHDPGSVSLTSTLSEDSAAGTAVALISVNDTDYGVQGDVTYSLESSNTSHYFVIDSASGQVTLRCPIDFEMEHSNLPLRATVLAVDGDVSSPRTGTSTIDVTVTDVNDNVPSCIQGYVLLSTPEAAAATSLITINCTDDDISATHNTLTYSAVVSPDDGNITVVGSALSTTGALDFERVTSYEGYVNITDGTFSTQVPFKVAVTPVNEAGPVFSSSTFAVSVSEDVNIGTQIATVSATDSDSEQDGHGKVIHSIIEVNSEGHFIIDSDTGVIAVQDSLDRETTASYTLTVNAVEEMGTNSANATLTVTVNDINDNSPVCTQTLQHQVLAENSANGTMLGSIVLNCSDADEGNNAALSFEIVSGNHGGAFEVSGTGLVVANSTAVDYESHTLFQLTVNVSDGGGLSDQISTQVSITNVNEHTPEFSSTSYAVSISEGHTLGQSIGANIAATDGDRGDTVSFAITGGNAEGKFSMESDGSVTVQDSLDRETTDYYSLEVTATDSAPSPNTLFATTTLNVTVLDENDNTPLCNASTYVATLPENTTVGTSVVDVICSDIDIGMNSNLTYNITAGNDEGKFTIDESTGAISLSASLNYEGTKTYHLTVSVTDGSVSAPLTARPYVAVHVTGVNEHTPVILVPKSGYKADVSEDASAGLVVLTMTATDADDALTPDGVPSWSITGGNIDDAFHLDATSGILRVNGALDRETTAEYNLTIRASDPDFHVETSAIITITDVNDNCPRFVSANYSVEVMENSTSEVTVLTVSTSDADEGLNSNHTFSILSSQGSTDFYFNDNSIVVNAILDCENQSVYGLVVQAMDRGSPPRSATVTAVVTVVCVNEYDPEFTNSVTNVTIAEDTPVGETILNLTATDRDKGCHGEVTFDTLSSGDTAFLVQHDSGMVVTAEKLDYDKGPKEYSIPIKALDSCCDGSVRSTIMAINVTITDVNDNCPYFNETFKASVYENITGDAQVLQVRAYDDDSTINAEVEYAIVGGDGDGSFVINSTTGIISTSASPALDFETNKTSVLIIRAADKGTPSLAGSATATVTILDSNDNTPSFNHHQYYVSFPEGQTSTNVLNFAGYDEDTQMNGQLSFGVFNDTDDHVTVIDLNGNRGRMGIIKAFDRETVPAYMVVLNVTDNGNPPLMGTASVYINVEDTNDNSPVFVSGQQTTSSISEDAFPAQHVLTVSATDVDFRENATVTYSIQEMIGNEVSPFGIVAVNGHIVVKSASSVDVGKTLLDRETRASWPLVVTATDNGSPPLSATITVTITVTDINDNTPVIKAPITHCVPDPTASGTSIFTPTATDADTGNNAKLSWYRNAASASTLFSVNAANGAITTNGELKGAFGSQQFQLCVKDAGSPKREDCKTVTVHIRNNCSFSMRYLREYSENTPVNTQLIDIPGLSGASFSILSSTDCQTYLKVGSSSGIVSINRALDRETHGNNLECQVQMTVPGITVTTTSSVDVTIRVTDINDNAPKFSATSYSSDVVSTINGNVNILQAEATDLDEGVNAQLTYEILELMFKPLFQIDSAGNLRKKPTAMLNGGTTYSLTVRATDGGTPPMTSPSVTLNVTVYELSNVITFTMMATVTNFKSNLNAFQVALASLVASLSGNNVKSVVIQQTTALSSASSRRKLLQTTTFSPAQTSVSVAVSISNNGDTAFMQASDLSNLLLTSDGNPIPQLYSGDLASFGIVSLGSIYNSTTTTTAPPPTTPPPDTPWLETPTGKAVISILCLVIAGLTAAIIVLAIKLSQASKRHKESEDEGSTESLKPRRNGGDLIAIPSSTRVVPVGRESPDSLASPETPNPGTTTVTSIGAPYDSSAFDPDAGFQLFFD